MKPLLEISTALSTKVNTLEQKILGSLFSSLLNNETLPQKYFTVCQKAVNELIDFTSPQGYSLEIQNRQSWEKDGKFILHLFSNISPNEKILIELKAPIFNDRGKMLHTMLSAMQQYFDSISKSLKYFEAETGLPTDQCNQILQEVLKLANLTL